jgi:hypothetical protein
MTTALGSLVVSLGLDAAQYTQGLSKAEYQAKQFAANLGKSVEAGVALAIGSLGAIAAAGSAAFAFLDRQAESIANFQGLSDKIGDTAESIASLKLAADISGTSFESIAATSVKLTATLAKVDDESKGAAAGIAALGINFEAFKKQSPVEQLDALAQGFAKFEDGPAKTAVAIGILGKSGADMLGLFQDLADGAQRQVTLTQAQIDVADAYSKQTARLRSEVESLAQQTTAGLIPSLSRLVDIISETVKWTANSEVGFTLLDVAMRGVTTIIQTLVVVGSDVAFVLRGIGTEIGGVAAQAAALMRLDFRGFSAISDAMKTDAAKARTELDAFQARVLAPQSATVGQAPAARPRLTVPRGLFGGGGGKKGEADNSAKTALDAQIKALEALNRQEEQALQAHVRLLDLYNGEALISTQDYYASRRAAQEQALAREVALFDQQIAAVEKFAAAASKASERESAQAKVVDLTAKKADAYRKAGLAATEMQFAERKALEGLTRELEAVNADVLELTGNLAAASKIRLDAQYSGLSDRLTANGDTAGLAQVQRLKDLKGAQAAFGQQTEEVGRITEGLRLQEERIALARQLGSTTELGALQQLGAARQGAVAQMQAMVTAQEAIARASGSPALVTQAEQARLALQQLQATIDPVADSINAKIDDGLANALFNVATGAMTAKDAVKGMFNTFARELLSMSTKDLAGSFRKALTGGGEDGGIGGIISKALSGSGGGGGGIGDWFSGLFGRASGGSVQPWQMVRVNENGPEMLDYGGKQYLMNGARNSRVMPLSGGGGSSIVNHINVLPGATRETGYQAARATARELQRAGAR